jgi:hypothetical protein
MNLSSSGRGLIGYNQLRIEVTRSGHFNPLFKEASQRCVRVYRVLLQREGGE